MLAVLLNLLSHTVICEVSVHHSLLHYMSLAPYFTKIEFYADLIFVSCLFLMVMQK